MTIGPGREPSLCDFSSLKFLVVEDDQDSREFLQEILRACGATVVEADSIRAAKESVRAMNRTATVTISVPSMLRDCVGGATELPLEAATVRATIVELV